MKTLLIFCLLGLNLLSSLSIAQDSEGHELSPPSSVSVAFDPMGNLWRIRSNVEFISVDVSHDLGKVFAKPVTISLVFTQATINREAIPRIAIGPEGNIYIIWAEVLKKPLSNYLWFSRSTDAGKTFEKPVMLHKDLAQSLQHISIINVTANRNLTVVWLTQDDLKVSDLTKTTQPNNAISYVVSNNKGVSFNPEQKITHQGGECSLMAVTNKYDGTVVGFWSRLFEGNELDQMIAEFPVRRDQEALMVRATFSHWKVNDCHNQGLAISTGGEGNDWWGYHLVYFDGNEKKPGLYYSRMDGVAWASSPPKRFGNYNRHASHPAVLAVDEKVWLVWQESEDKSKAIFGMFSQDGGRSWEDVKLLAKTMGEADYPQLIMGSNKIYLIWNTLQEGLMLLEL